jgi:hypothetical protein
MSSEWQPTVDDDDKRISLSWKLYHILFKETINCEQNYMFELKLKALISSSSRILYKWYQSSVTD